MSQTKMKEVELMTYPITVSKESHGSYSLNGSEMRLKNIVSLLDKQSYVFVRLKGVDDLIRRARLDLTYQLTEQYDWMDMKSDPILFKHCLKKKDVMNGIGNVDSLPNSCLSLQVHPFVVEIFKAVMGFGDEQGVVVKMDVPQFVPPGQNQSYIGYRNQATQICGLLTLTDQLMTNERVHVPASTLCIYNREKIPPNFFRQNPAQGVTPWIGLRIGFFQVDHDPLKDIRSDIFYSGRFGVHLTKSEKFDEEKTRKRMIKFIKHHKGVAHLFVNTNVRDIDQIHFPMDAQFKLGDEGEESGIQISDAEPSPHKQSGHDNISHTVTLGKRSHPPNWEDPLDVLKRKKCGLLERYKRTGDGARRLILPKNQGRGNMDRDSNFVSHNKNLPVRTQNLQRGTTGIRGENERDLKRVDSGRTTVVGNDRFCGIRKRKQVKGQGENKENQQNMNGGSGERQSTQGRANDILGDIVNRMNTKLVTNQIGDIRIEYPQMDDILQEMTVYDELSPLPNSPLPERSDTNMTDESNNAMDITLMYPKENTIYKLYPIESSYTTTWTPGVKSPITNANDPRMTDSQKSSTKGIDGINHIEEYVTEDGLLNNMTGSYSKSNIASRSDMDCKSTVDSRNNLDSRSDLDYISDMDCKSTVDSRTNLDSSRSDVDSRSDNTSLFTSITHNSPSSSPNRLDAEEEAKRAVAKLYEEDRRVMQKHRDHSMKNKVCAPDEVRLDDAPLSTDVLPRYHHCNFTQLKIYQRKDPKERKYNQSHGITNNIIVLNDDLSGRVSRCFVQQKSVSHLKEEIRGAETLSDVLKSYAWAYVEYFGHKQKKKRTKSIFCLSVKEGEDENLLLKSLPEMNRVYTVIKMPKSSMDSDHFWFDPYTSNRDNDKLDTMVKNMLKYMQNDHSQLTEELQRFSSHHMDKDSVTKLVDTDMLQLTRLCKLIEESHNETRQTLEEYDTKLIHHVKIGLGHIMQMFVEHISHPKRDILFSYDHLLDMMGVFEKLEHGHLFGPRHFFNTVKRHGLTYTDMICKMALPYTDRFVSDLWHIISLGDV